MLIAKTLSYYKRRDVQEAIVEHGMDKEIAILFRKGFGKRPEILQYASDVLSFAQKGALSFHCSEELWTNPSQLSSDLNKEQLDRLRKGWDLVLDIDCRIFDYSKLFAISVIELLQALGVRHLSLKFSGNKGFHIGIAFEAFPKAVRGMGVVKLYPELPRRIARFVLDKVKTKVGEDILKHETIDTISKRLGMSISQIGFINKVHGEQRFVLDVEKFANIDTLLISSRHLYRMPYSFHEKSGLVSIPLKISELADFKPETATPERVVVDGKFITRTVDEEEARFLVLQALDHKPMLQQAQDYTSQVLNKDLKPLETPTNEIPMKYFPDCILKGLQGLHDGRKRFLFILTNFLRSLNWDFNKIEALVLEWNKKNARPLPLTYIKSQLNYAKKHKSVMPPNCDRSEYYEDIGIKCSDCDVKNPVNKAIRNYKAALSQKPTKRNIRQKPETAKNEKTKR